MFFYLHYILLTSGLSGTSVLLAVYFKTYSDATQGETGALLMAIPFVNLFIKPIFCSMADRRQSHRISLMIALFIMMIGFAPFLVIPSFPGFYQQYPRYSWYVQVVACLVGSSGLGVAWSLGDCLAVNHSQRTGVPFGRMRFMGTLSWGVYGFIIGQINEHPALPKYTPAFMILHLSVALELLLLVFWDRESFEMVDPLTLGGNQTMTTTTPTPTTTLTLTAPGLGEKQQLPSQAATITAKGHHLQLSASNIHSADSFHAIQDQDSLAQALKSSQKIDPFTDSVPSSLGGTVKIKPDAAKALMEAFASGPASDEELIRRLQLVQQEQQAREQALSEQPTPGCVDKLSSTQQQQQQQQQQVVLAKSRNGKDLVVLSRRSGDKKSAPTTEQAEMGAALAATRRNPQLVLLKMIILEDGRVLKYVVLFTAFGAFMAPLTFFFVSLEALCHERGYNFSQLAGAVLMSQALIETLAFIVAPYGLQRFSRWCLLSFALLIMSLKYVFYAGWFYDESVSPYWAVLAEWSHGIPYGIFCTILADVSLMFANQARLFIPELRRLGYISSPADQTTTTTSEGAISSSSSKETIEAEERSIKMALRATMQALFSGFMDGLGLGSGSLLCGLFSDLYSYHVVWQIFATLSLGFFAFHLLVELSRTRWSDAYKPRAGTKAFEIMELSRATSEAQRQRFNRASGKGNDNKGHARVEAPPAKSCTTRTKCNNGANPNDHSNHNNHNHNALPM